MTNDIDATCERIYWLLSDCLENDTQKRERAEQGLRHAEENTPDFFAALAMICTASDENASPRVRWLASVVGKNAMPRSWRPRHRDNLVTEEEREYVRGALLSSLAEPHPTIAAQSAIWIARIARLDYPTRWPELMPTICRALSTPSPPEAPHATLHALRAACELFSALASRRLTVHRNSFYAAAPPAFEAIRALFTQHVGVVLSASDPDSARRAFEIVDLTMKCLRVLLMHGFARVDDRPEIRGLFGDLLAHPHLFMRGADGGSQVEKRLSLLAAKLVGRTFERHPVDFQVFLPQFLEVYWQMLVNYSRPSCDDEICAQAAHFLHCVLICPEYNISFNSIALFRQGGPQPNTDDPRVAARQIVLNFFTDARVDALIESMLTKIFVLRDEEAARWRDDPDSFGHDDETTEWGTHSLRTSCDEIFKTLLLRDKRRIAPKVISLAESVPDSQSLLRGACYRAVGNAVYELEGLFDFEPWLQRQLGPVLQAAVGDSIEMRVLQSRAAWLVGQFVAQLTRESRRIVYGLLVNLMARPDGDRVVAFSSASALFNLAEDFGFVPDDFLPHLHLCVQSCFKLLLSSETLESKRTLLTLVGVLARRCPRSAVVSLLPVFTEAMPLVWQSDRRVHGVHAQTMGNDDSAEANMLKTALVVLLVIVLQKMGHWAIKDEKMRGFVHKALVYGTNLDKGGGGVYLSDDAFDLWRTSLACCTEYSKDMSDLFGRVPSILKDDPSRLKELAPVIESYALLGGFDFIQVHGSTLLVILNEIARNSLDRGCLAVAEIVDLLLQLFPNEAVHYLSDLMQYMFQACVSNKLSNVLSAAYAALMARAAVVNVEGVESVVLQGDAERVDALFNVLLERLDVVHRQKRKNLVVLALCYLMVRYKKSEKIRAHAPAVLNAAVQVLAAATDKPTATFCVGDFNNAVSRFGESGLTNDNPGTGDNTDASEMVPEDERRRKVIDADPTRQMRVGDAVNAMVAELRGMEGGDTIYEGIMRATGQEILKQLDTFAAEERTRFANAHR